MSTINNRARVRHGMKTSAGCPLIATLNELDGVSIGTGQQVAASFYLNADSLWTGAVQPEQKESCDERTKLSGAAVDGLPYFVRTMDGRTFSGRVGEDGLLARVDTFGEDEYEVYWGDEALVQFDQVTRA